MTKAKNWTSANMRYMRHQKFESLRIWSTECGVTGTLSVKISFAKKTACVGLPPPQMIEKNKPTSIICHSLTLNPAVTLISVHREYFFPDSFCRFCNATLDSDFCDAVRLSLLAMFLSSGSASYSCFCDT